MIACRPLDGESNFVSGSYVVSDSHDLVAHLLNVRAACSQSNVNEDRELLQRRAHDTLFNKFDAWVEENQSTPPVEVSYSYFCQFIREYVASFLRSGDLPDIRMPDVSTIDKRHAVRHSAVGFTKVDHTPTRCVSTAETYDTWRAQAQDILFGKCTGVDLDIDTMSYKEIVQLCATRIIASRQGLAHGNRTDGPTQGGQ